MTLSAKSSLTCFVNEDTAYVNSVYVTFSCKFDKIKVLVKYQLFKSSKEDFNIKCSQTKDVCVVAAVC